MICYNAKYAHLAIMMFCLPTTAFIFIPDLWKKLILWFKSYKMGAA